MSPGIRVGPRARGLPRNRPPTEPNIIQRPELVRQLQRFLGLRQAHVAPALNEGVQPVVVLGDLSQKPVREIGGYCSAEGNTSLGDGTAGGFSAAIFDNPSNSGVKGIVCWYQLEGIGQSGTPQNTAMGFTFGLPVVFPMLLAPNNSGGPWWDGDPTHFTGTSIQGGLPQNQGRPKCSLYVGKAVNGIIGFVHVQRINDVAGDRLYRYEPAAIAPPGLVVYPGEQLEWNILNNAAASGTFEINAVWFEEPLGSGAGTV